MEINKEDCNTCKHGDVCKYGCDYEIYQNKIEDIINNFEDDSDIFNCEINISCSYYSRDY